MKAEFSIIFEIYFDRAGGVNKKRFVSKTGRWLKKGCEHCSRLSVIDGSRAQFSLSFNPQIEREEIFSRKCIYMKVSGMNSRRTRTQLSDFTF